MSDGKFYWLKLKRDFFKRHDVHCINGMENGETHVTVNTENGEQSFVTPREFTETFGPVKRNFVAKISAYNTALYAATINVRIYACKGEEAFVLKASNSNNGKTEAEYRIDF